MQRTTTTLFLLSFCYIIIFSLGSFTSLWWLQCIFEILAILGALYLSEKTLFGQATEKDYDISFSLKGIPFALLVFPILALGVILISKGTSFITGILGIQDIPSYGNSIWQVFLSSVLISSIVEELFCRYIFLRHLTIFSKKGAILLSALFFAFLHGNLDQFFYAFFAGILLATIACMTNSILPGIVIHFLNNVISWILIFFPETFPYVTIALLVWLVISFVCLIIFKKKWLPYWRTIQTEDKLPVSTMAKQFFLSPLLIFFLLFTAEAVLRILA